MNPTISIGLSRHVILCLAALPVAAAAAPDVKDAALAMRVLKTNCLSCHNAEKRKGGLDLTSREALQQGGENGAVVVDGQPEESPLIQSLAAAADPHMPPKQQLSAARMALLAQWVQQGTPWDAAALAGQPLPSRPVALAPLPSTYRPVMTLALSPDGTRLAAGCRNEVLLFGVGPEALTLLARASAHPDPVQSLAWSPDGKRLISGAFRRVVVWQAATLAQEREIITGLSDRIMALQILTDGTQVILADGPAAETGIVRVLDPATGQITRSWPAHDDSIFAMALSSNGTLLATAGGDRLVKIWDFASGKEVSRLEAHSTQVLGLAFNPDSSQLVTGGADRLLKIWDVKTRENTIAPASRTAAVNAVLWSAAGPAVFAVTDDGVLVRYMDLKPHTGAQSSDTGNEREMGRTAASLFCLTATPDGQRIFAGSSDGHILGWNGDGKLLDNIDAAMTPLPAPAAPPP